MVLHNETGLRELALFAGAGGGILGGLLCGWRTVAAVEIEEYPRAVLLQRQLDGILPKFPVWDDVRTFDGRPWRGKVDIVTGGFPCQDISAAGRGAGLAGERSGLWSEMERVIGEVRPRFALVENSPMLTGRGLDHVLMDLAEMGYDARWCVLGADDAGAPHVRKRIWVLAYAEQTGLERQRSDAGEPQKPKPRNRSTHVAYANTSGRDGRTGKVSETDWRGQPQNGHWWSAEPDVGRVAHGVANRVDRLKSIGNGQVPAVVKLAWDNLSKGLI